MFEEDLENWRKIEVEFAVILLRRGATEIKLAPNEKFKDWDIKADEATYEVKDDIASTSTGNVWFEYMCNNEASGIYVSKADYIVYHINGKFYCVPRSKLLVRLEFIPKEKKKWGDWNRSNLFIVKKSDFLAFVNRQGWRND